MVKSDKTTLDVRCGCKEPNNCRRYQCGECIKSYVRHVSYQDALHMAKSLRESGLMIASERVAEYATELHYHRRLTKED